MAYDEALLRRYNKIHSHAESGVDGEQSNARSILAGMKRQHPGIATEAEALRLANKSPSTPDPTNQPANGNFGGVGTPPRWQRWGHAAENAFGWASRVMEEATRTNYAQQLAAHIVEFRTRRLRSGKWQLSIAIDENQMDEVAEVFNAAQKQAFASYVAFHVQTAILRSLEVDEEVVPTHQYHSRR